MATRWISHGDHTGMFKDFAPTGRRISFAGFILCRFADGKVVEEWEIVDSAGLTRQLSSTPPSA